MYLYKAKIANSLNTIPLYVITPEFDYIESMGYEECFSKQGDFMGHIHKGYEYKNFKASNMSCCDIKLEIQNNFYKVCVNRTPLSIKHMVYDCKDILIGYSKAHLDDRMSEERSVFENFLAQMNDFNSIIYSEDFNLFDSIRENTYKISLLKQSERLFKECNFFIEICISSKNRHNYRRLDDRTALLNWNRIKHIYHNQLLLKSIGGISTKRTIEFLINRLNQKSIIVNNDKQYKQLIQMKL